MTLKRWLSISKVLGIAAAIGLVLSALALQDISHGEADVQSEWWAVRIGLLVMAAFISAALLSTGM